MQLLKAKMSSIVFVEDQAWIEGSREQFMEECCSITLVVVYVDAQPL